MVALCGCAMVALLAHDAAACASTPFALRGDSLAPLVGDGEAVTVYLGGDCPDPQRGDLVLFRLGARLIPLLKIVVAVPGDRFGLRADGATWNIVINDGALANFEGVRYRLAAGQERFLRVYVQATRGVVPQGAWLVVGDDPAGSLDPSGFGLIHRSAILGGARLPARGQRVR